MLATRDLGILAEAEVHQRAEGKQNHWEVGAGLHNYKEILEAANLQLKGKEGMNELIARIQNPDPAIRFWAVSGLGVITHTALPDTVAQIVPHLKAALQDRSVSVRLVAAESLCNLGYYSDAVSVLSQALVDPSVSVRMRASGILDTQPPEADAARTALSERSGGNT